MFKKAGILTAIVAAIAMPVAAQAWAPLKIVNHTNLSSVVKVGATNICSNILGDVGITRPGQSNVVPDAILFANCISSPENCVATVYLNANADCNSPPVGTVTYSLYRGVISASNGRVTVMSPAEVDLN